MQLLILSDIHGNVSALDSVMEDVSKKYHPDAAVVLGDSIDYGMRSNEIIKELRNFPIPIVCSLWGNHEYAVMEEDYSGFSSERGVQSARYTRGLLTEESLEYLNSVKGKGGRMDFVYGGKKFLAVHGSLMDRYWGSILAGENFVGYESYDYVLSGHTHLAHAFPVFYDFDDKRMRNKKRTFFLNPGSVGQPRNHDPRAQYAVLDYDAGIFLCGAAYDICFEQGFFTGTVDDFYRIRLEMGV